MAVKIKSSKKQEYIEHGASVIWRRSWWAGMALKGEGGERSEGVDLHDVLRHPSGTLGSWDPGRLGGIACRKQLHPLWLSPLSEANSNQTQRT